MYLVGPDPKALVIFRVFTQPEYIAALTISQRMTAKEKADDHAF